MRLSGRFLICLLAGFPTPVLARRLTWYEDRAFNPGAARRASAADVWLTLGWCLLGAAALLGLAWRWL
jgi:hypothetical protein